MAASAPKETYYRLLNVEPEATASDITRAYREAIKRAHPDRALPEFRAQAEDITKDLNRAYATLSDPAKRRMYDRSIMQQRVQEGIMNRYVAGMSGPAAGGDPFASHLKREMTLNELRERRKSDRGAMVSLFSAFMVLLLGGIGLLLIFALVGWIVSALI